MKTMKVALFVTCLADTMFPSTGQACVQVLERLGVDVAFPQAQTCCGQMHINTGYRKQATQIMRSFVDAFDGYDAVVAPSSSCVAAVRHYHPKLAEQSGDRGLQRRVAELTPKVLEFSEFLVDTLGVVDVGAYFPHAVTYHSSCHSLRALELGERPYQLLRAVRGLKLLDLPKSEECCGFGGTFSVKFPEVSTAMADMKLQTIAAAGADAVVTSDPGCITHLAARAIATGSHVRFLHLAEVAAMALPARQGVLS